MRSEPRFKNTWILNLGKINGVHTVCQITVPGAKPNIPQSVVKCIFICAKHRAFPADTREFEGVINSAYGHQMPAYGSSHAKIYLFRFKCPDDFLFF